MGSACCSLVVQFLLRINPFLQGDKEWGNHIELVHSWSITSIILVLGAFLAEGRKF